MTSQVPEQVIEGYRLSPHQKHLWLLQQDGTPYRSVCAIKLAGPVDVARVHSAVDEVVKRHEILRTSFHRMAGMKVPVQVVHEHSIFAWQQIDLSADVAQEAKLVKLYDQERGRDVDFAGEAVLQATLVVLSPDKHILIAGLPALCADARTLRNLSDQISRCYGVSSDDSAGDPFQYADFSEWRNEMVEAEEEEAERGRAYWRKEKEHPVPFVTLPFEIRRRKEAAAGSAVPDRVQVGIDESLAQSVERLAAQCEATTDTVLLSCWQTLLWRLIGQSEMVVGYVADGRKYEELRDAAGLFAKAVPVRIEIEKAGASAISCNVCARK